MIRAHIHEGYMGDLSISLVDHPEAGSMDMRPRIYHFGGSSFLNSEEIPADGTADEPTIRLHHEMARPLLDALTRYFDGAEDTRALRKDYDAERKRVDKLTDTVSMLALKLADPA